MVSSQDLAQSERRRHRNRLNAARARQRNKANLQRLETENHMLKQHSAAVAKENMILKSTLGDWQVDRARDGKELYSFFFFLEKSSCLRMAVDAALHHKDD